MKYSLRKVKRDCFWSSRCGGLYKLTSLLEALLRVEKGLVLEMGAESGGLSELEG